MRRFFLGFLLFGASTAYGSTILVAGPSGITAPGTSTQTTNIVNWAQLGSNDASVSEAFTATSSGGTTVNGSFAAVPGGSVLDSTDALLSTQNGTSSDGPLTLSFASGIYGAGAEVDASASAMIEVTFYAGTSIAAMDFYSGNSFFGLEDSSAAITKIVINLIGGPDDFAIDSLYLSANASAATTVTHTSFAPAGVPEPGMFPIMGTALAGLLAITKKRAVRA